LAAPNTTKFLPQWQEGKDGLIQLGRIVNQLIRRLGNQLIAPAGAKLSFDLGNNIIGGSLVTETVIWQRPVPYAVFGLTITAFLAATAKVTSGTATFALRTGSTEDVVGGSPTGTVIGTVAVASTSFSVVQILASFPTVAGPAQGYIKLTLVGGTTAQIKEGGLSLS
jgi:hypothetical protein